MQIGGMEFNMPFGSIGSILVKMFWGMIVLLIVGLVAFLIWRWYKNKVFYKTPVTLTLKYDNGTQETKYGLKGAKFIGKTGEWQFKVKIPKQRKPKEVGYLPDFSKADKDGTIHFVTCGDGTYWQQLKNEIIIKENNIILLSKPVIGSDEKSIMIKDIKNWRDVVAKNKVTAFAIGLGMFLIMVIAHLISLYIQTKIKCPI